MTVRMYTSDDAGAPQMYLNSTGTRGDFVAILKAVLVNGYGASTPAGWTMPYEDAPNNVAVFKNSAVGDGTGTYYRFDDDLSYQYYRARAYQSMTGVDTGLNAFPAVGDYATGLLGFKRSSATIGGQWKIFACERGAYIFVGHYPAAGGFGPNLSSQGCWDCFFIGDINSYINGDPYCGSIFGRRRTSWDFDATDYMFVLSTTPVALGQGTGRYMAADHLGYNEGIQAYLYDNGALNAGSAYPGGAAIASAMEWPDPITGRTYHEKFYLGHDKGIRGELPGAMYPFGYYPYTMHEDIESVGIFTGQSWHAMGVGELGSSSQVLMHYDCPTADWYTA